jgi:hypothetical protein
MTDLESTISYRVSLAVTNDALNALFAGAYVLSEGVEQSLF